MDGIFLHRGSVKDFYVYDRYPPTDSGFGIGYIEFRSDDPRLGEDPFSIFDYGVFPWGIPEKAQALYRETHGFFNILDRNGIKNHRLIDLNNRKIEVHVARIPESYNWIEQGETEYYLVPLEIVFSKIITPVSSLHKHLRRGKVTSEDIGISRPPEKEEVVILGNPYVRFSTKIEGIDEYRGGLTEQAGLIGDEEDKLIEIARDVSGLIDADAGNVGLRVADGKIEVLIGKDREIYVADTCYTWDECRLLYQTKGGIWVDLSKQVPRNIYTIVGYKESLKKAQEEFPDDKTQWPAPPTHEEVPELEDAQDICTRASNAVFSALVLRNPDPLEDTAIEVNDYLECLKEKFRRDETGESI